MVVASGGDFGRGGAAESTCVTLNGSGIQLAVGPQPLWLRNHNFGLAQRIMVKRLATSPHDPLGITDSACKNQLVVVSVQYGPFNPYIPIRSTTIVSRGNRHFTVDGGRLRQSGPRSDTRLLRQPALEGLTRSARTDSPRRVGRNSFRRLKAAAALGGGGGLFREEGGGRSS
ncbi:cleavage stimulation factor subunit 2-like [Dorcoceras hygrometricum]|uniref:Cleavage stimulation factor subunit 2-like n=1 Tax=Dorcoceras hygrometricum TaxID=472368 RepID=A0A2Z7DHM8_9LAMI|nr:cleavage stimulation factor subunit 2-like [Dorcoceras hygrometricum]